jgi:hypothetical protein
LFRKDFLHSLNFSARTQQFLRLNDFPDMQASRAASLRISSEKAHKTFRRAFAARKAATIEFTGESSGMPNGMPPGAVQEPNFNWSIRGYIKQQPADPNWPVNWFSIEPLY